MYNISLKEGTPTLKAYLDSKEDVTNFLISHTQKLTGGLDLSPEKLKSLQENICLVLSENLELQLNESTKHLQQYIQQQQEVLSYYPETDLRIRSWF